MIGESGGVGSLVYQEQVSRESQIQRSQESRQEEVAESSPQQMGGADQASFSAEALELSRTAVMAASESSGMSSEMPAQQQSQQTAGMQGGVPGQTLDIMA